MESFTVFKKLALMEMANFKYQQGDALFMLNGLSSPGSRTAAILIAIIMIAVFPIPGSEIPTVEAGERPNRHAIIEVEYSPSRPPDISQDRVSGVIEIELYEKRAPITTANFIKLAEEHFFDNLIFHRVIDDFVIQGGDPNTRDRPTGTPADWWDDGNGGSAETIPLESHPELTHVDGAIGMAREFGEPDSASSQFYICDGPQHRLDDTEENNQNRTYAAIDDRGYAVFGVTVQGIDVVREIASVWTTTDEEEETPDPIPTAQAHVHDHPVYDAVIERVYIIQPPGEDDDDDDDNLILYGGLGVVAMGGIMVATIWKYRPMPLTPLFGKLKRKSDLEDEADAPYDAETVEYR